MGKKYKVGYVQGTFDLFHIGHLLLIQKAKARCEHLIVGVVSDELSKSYKGMRPYIFYEDRVAIVGALRDVDEVMKVDFANEDKLKIWDMCHFDCHFSGNDHIGWEMLIAKLRRRGSDVEFFPYTERTSSTKIKTILRNRALYGLAAGFPVELLSKRVAIYGAGRLGKDLHRKITDLPDKEVVLWVDKNYAKLQEGSLSVVSPDRLLNISYDEIVIAVMNGKTAAVIRQDLIDQGIPEDKILWVDLRGY